MGDQIHINLEKLVISGNVLDVGIKNYGIIYNLYKHYNDEIAVDYFEGKNEKNNIQHQCYDNCILFFTLHQLLTGRKKELLIQELCCMLKEEGCIFIWDIDKGIKSIFNSKIKVQLPNKTTKEFRVTDFNYLKNNAKEKIKAIIEKYCEIEEYSYSNNLFYMKAKKKGKLKDESIISSS